jgi:peptidoglycan/LPS O-acetylase OafA/YrhL
MYIVFGHAWLTVVALRPDLLSAIPGFYRINASGNSMVGMFLVVSGYVLGLPVARHGQRFRGGLVKFAKRRALRLLPGYYAALLLAIPISLCCATVLGDGLSQRTFALAIVLHVLMLHDVLTRTVVAIDGPLWSVAVECDIYVLFALLLVPLARRAGFLRMVVASFALGLLPTLIGALRHQGAYYPLAQASPWFLGLFALGYAAANLSINDSPRIVAILERWPWQSLAFAAAFAAIAYVVVVPPGEAAHTLRWLEDSIVGVALAAQFVADARARRAGRTTPFERFWRFRPFIFVGAFSYSLYLIHQPLLDVFAAFVRSGWSDAHVIRWMALAAAFAVIVSYPFYLLFERPFVTSYRRKGDAASLRGARAVVITTADPAP